MSAATGASMRIAQVAQLWHSVPPKKYGGVERVVSYLTEELVKQGHEVTLYASADSRTRAHLEALWPVGLREAEIICKEAPIIALLKRVADTADRFDVIHSHLDWFGFPLVDLVSKPVVTTIHGWIDLPELRPLFMSFRHAPLVSISDAQRQPFLFANWQATVHHGLPRDLYTFSSRPRHYIAFLGRISAENGADSAIQLALEKDIPLRLAGPVHIQDQEYFDAVIRPQLSHPLIEYVGELTDKEKNDFLGEAMALIWPFVWPQAFGLGIIESLACGTPVIASRRGGPVEIIDEGKTGWLCQGRREFCSALSRVSSLSREQCRGSFETRFSLERMTDDYLAMYDTYLVPGQQLKRVPHLRPMSKLTA